MGRVRLLICDDSDELRAALRTMLAGHAEIELVGEAGNGEEAIAKALEHEPDTALMDVAMPLLDGVEATRRIRELLPALRIVAFAGSDDTATVMAMIEAGASAYCVKGAPLWELERAIVEPTDPLVRLARTLARTASAELVAREFAEATRATVAATFLADAEGSPVPAGSAGKATLRPGFVPAIVGRAFTAIHLARADAEDLAELRAAGCACSSALAVPLVTDGAALGAVLVAAAAPVDEELVAAAADLASAALATERRLAVSFAEARRDALTGLANKRAFDEHLQRLVEQVSDAGGELSVALFDLDDFKRINDEHGHAAGDETLRELAKVMLRSLRANEEAFRIGGEEFGVVVIGGAEAGARVAERIRDGIRGHRRGRGLPTVSAGVAAHFGSEPRDELVRRADVALYAAKRAGKNRVVVHRQETALEAANGRSNDAGKASRPNFLGKEEDGSLRILLVDDDEGLRTLLRTTFEAADVEVEEAVSADGALALIAADPPDIVVLDVWMPGTNGMELCRRLKADASTSGIRVILLTGSDEDIGIHAVEVGADALLRKPFSPLELLAVTERLATGRPEAPFRTATERASREQLLLYAEDLRRLREVERGQRALLQRAYRETVTALATALESKDVGTGKHSQRVLRYAMELAWTVEPGLLEDTSIEYGFLLHDVGKIGIPDVILSKKGPLTTPQRRKMQTHTVLGEQMLGEVALLQGEGLRIVRSHHERWDGSGYPDRLGGDEIPIAARIFAIADALDAMTTDRSYRKAGSWKLAVSEIVHQSRRQFDPGVVEAFMEREPELRAMHYELIAA